jgi:outer membrane protein OmpA-like peptidoglycan-associated protein
VFTEGIVVDEADETETPLTDAVVSLYLEDPETGEEVLIKTDTTIQNDLDYIFKLQPHKRYKISAYKKGYFTGFTKVSTKGIMKSDTMRAANILLKKIPPKDSTITIKNIYYEFDKADVTESSKDTLEKNLLGFLKDNPTIVIEIGAHTDSKGSELYNMQLSQKRAESVVQYLVDKGIMEKRLIPVGYGESKPIAKNKNEDGSDNVEGREKNRRTEFKVMNELPENLVIDYEE